MYALIIKIISLKKKLSLFNIKNESKNWVYQKRIKSCCKKQRLKKAQNMSTKELLHTLSRYDTKRKVNSNRRKIFKMGLEKIAKL